jgi:hypothetical protein
MVSSAPPHSFAADANEWDTRLFPFKHGEVALECLQQGKQNAECVPGPANLAL